MAEGGVAANHVKEEETPPTSPRDGKIFVAGERERRGEREKKE